MTKSARVLGENAPPAQKEWVDTRRTSLERRAESPLSPAFSRFPGPACDHRTPETVGIAKDTSTVDAKDFCQKKNGSTLTASDQEPLRQHYPRAEHVVSTFSIAWSRCEGLNPEASALVSMDVEEDLCIEAFDAILNECTRSAGVYGGSTAATCLQFSHQVASHKTKTCGGDNPGPDPRDMNRDDALYAIFEYCHQENLFLKDEVAQESGESVPANPWLQEKIIGDVVYRPQISWTDTCEDKKDTSIDSNECSTILNDIIDGCPDYEHHDKKHGGSVIIGGCIRYQMYGGGRGIDPTATGAAKCYPSHDTDVPLKRLGENNIENVCKGQDNPARLGNAVDPSVGSNNNVVEWEFKKFPDAPSECSKLLKEDNDLFELCATAYQKIADD
ncbi:MAG: hypothetical protein M1837_004316, partial [Sclerophora amabilis]